MADAQTISAENILKTKEMTAFDEIYGKMAADISSEHTPVVRAVCAKVFSSEEGRSILTDLAEKDVKLSSRMTENKIEHDLFGKYIPGNSFIGIGDLFASDKKEFDAAGIEKAASFVQQKMKRATAFDLNQPVDRIFYFQQAVNRNDQSKEFYDFADANNVEHLILSENAAASEKKSKSDIYHFHHSQLKEDRLLLRKYEASRREPSLRPRYLRALQEYEGNNNTVKALKKYTSVRFAGEVRNAQNESLTDRVFSAVRSWGVRSGR